MFTKAAADDCRQPQQEAQADGYGFDSIHNALQLLPSRFFYLQYFRKHDVAHEFCIHRQLKLLQKG